MLKVKHEFNVAKVESTLFDMIGLITCPVENQAPEDSFTETELASLNHKDKQEYYLLARAPVLKLEKELSKVYKELTELFDSEQYFKKLLELKELQTSLKIARQNAANDIFERVNSRGNMGAIADDNDKVYVDLHGLHVNEAKDKLNEVILPALIVLKKLILITGHGVHNQTGDAVLKNSIKTFLKEKKLRCEDDCNNKGPLVLYA